jgi:hypothetical protein
LFWAILKFLIIVILGTLALMCHNTIAVFAWMFAASIYIPLLFRAEGLRLRRNLLARQRNKTPPSECHACVTWRSRL